jgi:hypothetical protein
MTARLAGGTSVASREPAVAKNSYLRSEDVASGLPCSLLSLRGEATTPERYRVGRRIPALSACAGRRLWRSHAYVRRARAIVRALRRGGSTVARTIWRSGRADGGFSRSRDRDGRDERGELQLRQRLPEAAP